MINTVRTVVAAATLVALVTGPVTAVASSRAVIVAAPAEMTSSPSDGRLVAAVVPSSGPRVSITPTPRPRPIPINPGCLGGQGGGTSRC